MFKKQSISLAGMKRSCGNNEGKVGGGLIVKPLTARLRYHSVGNGKLSVISKYEHMLKSDLGR